LVRQALSCTLADKTRQDSAGFLNVPRSVFCPVVFFAFGAVHTVHSATRFAVLNPNKKSAHIYDTDVRVYTYTCFVRKDVIFTGTVLWGQK
jgi:hypothetical protein